jgi:protein-tyrosine-phosphatase
VGPVVPGPGEERTAVLFACTLNCIRSPMAAAILDHLAGDRIDVLSAGVRAGQPDPYAVAVMDEIGIDLSEHEPQQLSIIGDRLFDVVVSLSPEAHHHTLELTRTMATEVEYWPTMDCSLALSHPKREQILAAYRDVRDELFRRNRQRFALEGGPTV